VVGLQKMGFTYVKLGTGNSIGHLLHEADKTLAAMGERPYNDAYGA